MPRTDFVDLGQLSQPPLLYYTHGQWTVWLHYNRERTAGTYLILGLNGSVVSHTLLPTGEIVNVATIKP